jgi:hypothetical protein
VYAELGKKDDLYSYRRWARPSLPTCGLHRWRRRNSHTYSDSGNTDANSDTGRRNTDPDADSVRWRKYRLYWKH